MGKVAGTTTTEDAKDSEARSDANASHHLCVCICTFKRPELLGRLLASIAKQSTGEGRFSFSIVIADNDARRSAETVVSEFASQTHIPVSYCVESEQNIALARNKALNHSEGDFAVFIDDDEFPADNWLQNLLETCLSSGSDGVLGPVKPYFEVNPPEWIKTGRFFDRPSYPTGFKLDWDETRTGNVLFKKSILKDLEVPFRPEFATAGEDMDFFRRMMEKGHTFVWCNEAIAYESVPAWRCTRKYLFKRALLRGSNFPKHPKHRVKNIVKSVIAIPCYVLALPFLSIVEHGLFVRYLVKLLDHASRLLAFVGLPLAKERQT